MDGDIGGQITRSERETHALDFLLGEGGLGRVDQILDEVAGVEEHARGLVVGNVEEIEALTGGGGFGGVDDGDFEAFGGFVIGPEGSEADEGDQKKPDGDAMV